jgi:glycosyltransferase involved in cell wall biosynthesis
MRVLHAYNQHRGGGGSNNATNATIEVCRARGVATEVFTRRAADLPSGVRGRLQAATTAFVGRDTVQAFEALLDSFRPDVVHAHELFPLVSPWILPLCTRRNVPVVMTCVDYRLTCPVVTHLRHGQICTRCSGGQLYWAALGNCRQNWAESVTMAMYGTMVRSFDLYLKHVGHLIAPSEFTRAWLIEHLGIAADRVSAIAPVVDVPETVTETVDGEYVAFAGRFAPEKGIGTLLEAARLARLPVRLARNEKSLITVEIPPDASVVVTHGRDDLARFYRAARFVVVPSVWFETFGLVGAEAMSHGVPVVASRIGALAELVEDGVDGLQFEPGRPDDLADKMTRLWADADLRRRMGRAARQKVERVWSADRHFEQTCALYERELQRTRQRRLPHRASRPPRDVRVDANERITERS